MSNKIKTIFVLGGPGSGKGTLCKKLKDLLGFVHLSWVDILRNIIKTKKYENWENIKKIVDKGEFLVPEEMVKLIKYYYEDVSNKIVLLDGFPRIKENDEAWHKLMDESTEVIALLYLDCSKKNMIHRINQRKDCRNDNNEDIINKRIQHFYNETIKVIEQYSKKNLTVKIDANKNFEGVLNDTLKYFKNKPDIIP